MLFSLNRWGHIEHAYGGTPRSGGHIEHVRILARVAPLVRRNIALVAEPPGTHRACVRLLARVAPCGATALLRANRWGHIEQARLLARPRPLVRPNVALLSEPQIVYSGHRDHPGPCLGLPLLPVGGAYRAYRAGDLLHSACVNPPPPAADVLDRKCQPILSAQRRGAAIPGDGAIVARDSGRHMQQGGVEQYHSGTDVRGTWCMRTASRPCAPARAGEHRPCR